MQTRTAILPAILLLGLGAARAGATPCDNGWLFTYKWIPSASGQDSRGDCTSPPGASYFNCTQTRVQLQGWFYYPTTPKPAGGYPVIIYNHGSEDMATSGSSGAKKCPIVNYFVPKGFVVFVPHRRGHGESTGIMFDAWEDMWLDLYCPGSICTSSMRQAFKDSIRTSYLQDQANDVKDAWTFLQGFPDINQNKLAIMGHSFGGVVTLFTNQTDLGQKAAIDLCGASEQWSTFPTLDAALFDAVDHFKTRVFFAQPHNDVNISPTIELSHEAGLVDMRFQATIYPDVPGATTGQQAHSQFVTDSSQIDIWGPGALDFMARFGVK